MTISRTSSKIISRTKGINRTRAKRAISREKAVKTVQAKIKTTNGKQLVII